MFLSLLVAWLIPDVPKPIVEQLKREKTLLVDVFLREEKEKYQLIHSLFGGGGGGGVTRGVTALPMGTGRRCDSCFQASGAD
uniref:Uncharacterized protein n=1 Tax=Gadus morhua TaxID=8049 RepID=A0A8C5C9K6_GADMO